MKRITPFAFIVARFSETGYCFDKFMALGSPSRPRVPIPEIPKVPIPDKVALRVPGLSEWYHELHRQMEEWRKQTQIALQGTNGS